MGQDELPAELLKLGLSDSSHEILLAFHDIIVAVWMTGEVPQEWKDAIIKVLHKRRIGPTVATTGASLWRRMLARFSSKSWPTDLAILRRSWDPPQRTVRLPTPTLDNQYDVCRAQTSGTGTDKQHFPRDLLHRSGKSIRLGRSCAIVGSTCPFWSSASDDQGHPPVSR